MSIQQYIEIEKKRGVELRDYQMDTLPIIASKKSVLIIYPTGGGKTKGAIYACLCAKAQGYRVIWVAPLKSLTFEQKKTLESYGLEILIVNGDFRKNKNKIATTKADVIILTSAMLNVLMVSEKKRNLLMKNVSTIVVDEVHDIADGEMGAKLESTIKMIGKTQDNIQFVMLSATVRNYTQLAKWLKAELFYVPPEKRPIPLEKHIVTYQKERNSSANYETKREILRQQLNGYGANKPKIIVFCSSRDRCRELSEAMQGVNGYRCGYHHAGLKKKQRQEMEDAFRGNGLDLICSTPTLARGVNLPADKVFLFDVTRWNYIKTQEEFITRNEMIQMIGRAGRFGISKFSVGEAIAYCGGEEATIVNEMWNNPMMVTSQIPKALDVVLLQWVVAGFTKMSILYEMYKDIYADPLTLSREDFILKMKWLRDCGFIKGEDEKLIPTYFGRMTTYMAVRPKTSLHFLRCLDNLNNRDDVTYYDLFKVILDVEEFTENIVIRRSRSDAVAVENGNRFLGWDTDDRVKKAFAMTFNSYLSEMHGCQSVGATNSDLFILRDASSRIINACLVIIGGKLKHKEKLKILNQGIMYGTLEQKIIDLIQIEQIGITRGVKLFKAGIKTVDQFMRTPNQTIKQILGRVSLDTIDTMKQSAMDILEGETQTREMADIDDIDEEDEIDATVNDVSTAKGEGETENV